MDIRPQTYVWVVCFFFYWKCEHGTGTKMNTWQQSVLDCYRDNSALESNITVLKNYMNNHTEVNSIWVGSFEALLPWVEIRGCYNISLIRKRDEHVAENSPFCQVKCMNRQYFAFCQNDETCVCFDEHDIVKTESDNASLCHECTNKGDCSSYAVVYKVFNKSISVEGYDIDYMSYECSSQDAVPLFHETRCSQYCVSLCRNGQRADISKNLQFAKYRSSCKENHFTYPLLHTDNPVKLCNMSLIPGEDIWVGVYRQKLHLESFDKTVPQDFNKIVQYISHCYYLSMNDTLLRTENCSVKQDYKCTSVDEFNSTDYVSFTTTLDFEDESTSSTAPGIDNVKNATVKEDSSSGMIAGVTVSIMVVMLIVAVIMALVYSKKHHRILHKTQQLGKGERTSQINHYTTETIPQGHYHEIYIPNGDYSLAKPISSNAVYDNEVKDEDETYVRATSGVYDKLNDKDKRKLRSKYSNENPSKLQEKNIDIYTINSNRTTNEQCKDDVLKITMSSDYCLAKPIADTNTSGTNVSTADCAQLDNVEKNKSTKPYDQWQMTNEEDNDPTYNHTKNIIPREENSNYDHCSIKK